MNSTNAGSTWDDKLFPYMEFFPKLHETVFLASVVKIIGNVEVGENSSVWYNTVIRGDVHYIKIGAKTNIQDCSMLHVTNRKFPLNIGSSVTIGHSVNLHGCTLKNNCFVGIGSIILDGAVLEENSMVAAGAVVTPGFVVHSENLAAGVPAKIIRKLSGEEIKDIENSALRYINYVSISKNSLKKISGHDH